jgi:hypothetical protein
MKNRLTLYPVGILEDDIDRANRHTLRFVEMAHAFRTPVGIDMVNQVPLGDGLVGAFRFTNVTIDTIISN